MGGCLSTNTPSKHPKVSNHNTSQDTHVSKSPPPSHPFLEEETVKEVLSETPSTRSRVNPHSEGPFIKNAPLLSHEFKKPFAAHGGDISEELVSESESVSVYTAVAERNDDQLRHRSPAKRTTAPFPGGEARREKTVGRSPNRARPVTGPGILSRDGGESSGRRSRSPVTRTDSGDSGRSTFSRRTGKSPGRVRSASGERNRKVDGEREDVGDNIWPPTSGESLENPVVSMECFIFL